MAYTYTGVLFGFKNIGVLAFMSTWVILKDIMLGKAGQVQKHNLIYMWNPKKWII